MGDHPVLSAFWAISCPVKAYAQWQWMKYESFAQGAGLSRDRSKASRQRFSHPGAVLWSSGRHLILPAGGGFAPRHGQAVTLRKAQSLGRFTPPSSCPDA
jgi:hypothetical protein